MPRLCALLVLAGVAAVALRPRPAPAAPIRQTARLLTPGELALVLAVSPSSRVH